MAENKTKPTAKSVPEFLEQIENPKRKADCLSISALMEKLSGSEPKMWGDSIVGFGDYHYKYGKGCLYIKKLEDIDMDVLETLITTSIERLKAN